MFILICPVGVGIRAGIIWGAVKIARYAWYG